MDHREIGGAVVGHEPLDDDPVGAVEGHGAPQEADGACRLLVVENLGVGKAGSVIDTDVHELPAAATGALAQAAVARYTVSGAPVADPPELLDVDVDQLAGALPLVAVGGLRWLEGTEPAKADSGQDARDGRGRHPQALGDLCAGHAQSAQGGDRTGALRSGAVGHGIWL